MEERTPANVRIRSDARMDGSHGLWRGTLTIFGQFVC